MDHSNQLIFQEEEPSIGSKHPDIESELQKYDPSFK